MKVMILGVTIVSKWSQSRMSVLLFEIHGCSRSSPIKTGLCLTRSRVGRSRPSVQAACSRRYG